MTRQATVLAQRLRTAEDETRAGTETSPFVREPAGVSDSAEAADAARLVHRAYQLLYGRDPAPEELSAAQHFLGRAGETGLSESAWTDYCQALLGLNEFHFVD
jgi:hypothetical protein